MSCFKSNKTMYDSDATVLLNVYIHLVFVGEGYLALVPSCLPHLRKLVLVGCDNVCDQYVEELAAALPELKIISPVSLYQYCLHHLTVLSAPIYCNSTVCTTLV